MMADKSVIAYSTSIFSETRHFNRDIFPANTMAYDSLPYLSPLQLTLSPTTEAIWVKSCGKNF